MSRKRGEFMVCVCSLKLKAARRDRPTPPALLSLGAAVGNGRHRSAGRTAGWTAAGDSKRRRGSKRSQRCRVVCSARDRAWWTRRIWRAGWTCLQPH